MSFGVYNLLSHMRGTIYHNEQVLTQLLYGNLQVPNTYLSPLPLDHDAAAPNEQQ